MTNAVGSTSQNVALQPVAAPRPDPGVEAQEREQSRAAVEQQDAVREAAASDQTRDRDDRSRTLDRYA